MTAAFINVDNVPTNIEAIAAQALASCKRPRTLLSGRGDAINVGLRYRLFRPCGARRFQLMTHKRYNKLTSKKKRRG